MASEARGPFLSMGGVTLPGPAPHVLVWPLWPPSLTSCTLEGSHDKILTPEKSQVNLSLERFLKRKSTQNRFSCSAEL
jgi:hypothetical protein